MCQLKAFGCGRGVTSLRRGCITIFLVKMVHSLFNIGTLIGSEYVKETPWALTFLIVWTVIAVAFWIVLITGACIWNSTMIAISLIGLILNLIAYVFFMTLWTIDMFSEWAPGGGLLIFFTIVAVCLDIYFAWALASFFLALRKGESGSDLPDRT